MTLWKCRFIKLENGNGHIELWKEKAAAKTSGKNPAKKIDGEIEKQHEKQEDIDMDVFIFELERQKSQISMIEKLYIEAKYRGETCGKIMVAMNSLKDDIIGLKQYGVVLPRSTYNDICLCIEEHYLELEVNKTTKHFITTVLSDAVVEDIFKWFCENVIKEKNIKSENIGQKTLYPIPSIEFAKYFEESPYSYFNITKVKKMLKGYYTYTNGTGNDFNLPNNRGKAIAFMGKLVQEELEKMEKNEQEIR